MGFFYGFLQRLGAGLKNPINIYMVT